MKMLFVYQNAPYPGAHWLQNEPYPLVLFQITYFTVHYGVISNSLFYSTLWCHFKFSILQYIMVLFQILYFTKHYGIIIILVPH